MIDWQGLFKFSSQYTDGTAPSSFDPMTSEDRKWLEEVMAEYTHDDTDRMQKIIPILSDNHSKDKGELLEALEELQELIESHERNSSNLERMGGFKWLMDLMFYNGNSSARKLAMSIFSFCVQNNTEMQEAAHKHGGLHLLHQYIKEESD